MEEMTIKERIDEIIATTDSMYIGQAKLLEKKEVEDHLAVIRKHIRVQDAVIDEFIKEESEAHGVFPRVVREMFNERAKAAIAKADGEGE